MNQHIPFPSIDSFRHTVQHVRRQFDYHQISPYPTIKFRGSVKIHGTNAGVRMNDDGTLVAQSRERDLAIGSDNHGFAAFVLRNESFIRKLMLDLDLRVLFGEWAGSGIQKNVGVSQLSKRFILFAGRPNDVESPIATFPTLPTVFDGHVEGSDFFQVGYYEIDIDFNKPDAFVEELERLTTEVENECPYAKAHGIENSIGEGIVWRPLCPDGIPTGLDEQRLFFKTKGEKHGNKSVKTTVKVAVAAEKMEDFESLIAKILPQWRLDQGIDALKLSVGQDITSKNTGDYIAWINRDILKEESDTIAISEFPWKVVASEVAKRARNYYLSVILAL